MIEKRLRDLEKLFANVLRVDISTGDNRTYNVINNDGSAGGVIFIKDESVIYVSENDSVAKWRCSSIPVLTRLDIARDAERCGIRLILKDKKNAAKGDIKS